MTSHFAGIQTSSLAIAWFNNPARGSLTASADPVIESAWWNIMLPTPICICQTTPLALVDQFYLFRHRNTEVAKYLLDLTSIIVVDYSNIKIFLWIEIIGFAQRKVNVDLSG